MDENRINGKGRKTFSFSLKPNIMKDFSELCDSVGFVVSKRIEIAILHDMEAIKQLKSVHNCLVYKNEREGDINANKY